MSRWSAGVADAHGTGVGHGRTPVDLDRALANSEAAPADGTATGNVQVSRANWPTSRPAVDNLVPAALTLTVPCTPLKPAAEPPM